MKKLLLILPFTFLLLPFCGAQVTLYGLTSQGGDSGAGVVFSVTSNGIIDTVANLKFSVAAYPTGSLLYASDGNFYASSYLGGYDDSCTIFKCNHGGVLTTIINLDSVWGASLPMGNSLMQAQDGNLYGMTTVGGPNSGGVLYKLTLAGSYSAVYFFDVNAYSPHGSLIQTADGYLWGMTGAGGTYGYGTVFKCKTDGTFTVVHSFDIIEGSTPYGDLFPANDGNFYGLTSSGGISNMGTLFRISPSGTFTKLVDFNNSTGAVPFGSLIQASDGNLYGLTSTGGIIDDSAFGSGTLFMCTLSGNVTVLSVFTGDNGDTPEGTLMEASDGVLYGMASAGGAYGDGVVFKCPLGGQVSKIADFNGSNGLTPMYGKLIEIGYTQGVNEVSNTNDVKIYPNPSNGVFQMQANSYQLMANSQIQVYNMLGEKIANSYWPSANSQIQIDLSNQPAGVYLYRVISEAGDLVSGGKLIIQK